MTATFLSIVLAGFVLWPKVESVLGGGGEDARLEIAERVVFNPPAGYSSAGGLLDQLPATEPRIMATVRNRGASTAWIEEARITIVESARLSVCVSQGGGDVPSSKAYRVALPEFPAEQRRVLRRDLHVEVQPGHGVRPVLTFQKNDFGATNLYAVKVEFVADPGGHVLDAGRYVIGVPEPVDRYGALLPESDSILTSEATVPDDPVNTWCFRHNLAGVRHVLAEPGRRSADVAALAHLSLASSWDEFADDRPLRDVVPDLLASEYPEAFIYAVEAAELSGDPEFAAAVRERAIALLLEDSREELDDYAPNALSDAERVLSLGPSAEAERLIWKAKAARSAEEKRVERENAELEEG